MKLNYFLTSICAWIFISCCWFSLWVLSCYFVMDPKLAILLFPFSLRLGITLHTPKKYWATIYLSEWLLMVSLALLLNITQWHSILLASILTIPISFIIQKYYYGSQWRRLSVMGGAIFLASFINAVIVVIEYQTPYMIFLVSITGGLMLVPTCYLLWSYLFQNIWYPLSVNLVSAPVVIRSRHVVFCTILFVINIILQIYLPDELRRFAPFCLAIPIILLAFRYGWQGALLGTLLNSVALLAARSGVTNMELTDLLLSLSAQSLTGILLGIGIQGQRDLNHKLRIELDRNHNLARQLVEAEECVRADIARELHDEIGQNITAIRMQSNILQRIDSSSIGKKCASTIEQLSLNIYDTTKGLLMKLRPKTLDDLGLKEAVYQLIRELEFESSGIEANIIWNNKENFVLNDTTSVTLYRILQESLNNIAKYSKGTQVLIKFTIGKEIFLSVSDNGIGFNHAEIMEGFGLRGINERVQALGGTFQVRSSLNDNIGTNLFVELPIL